MHSCSFSLRERSYDSHAGRTHNMDSGSLVTLNPYLKSGEARVLMVYDTKRHDKYPEVPTAREKGYNVVRVSRHA